MTSYSTAEYIRVEIMSEQPLKMNSSNRKPIILYCSKPTQTQDSETEDSDHSDFPPCRIGNCPPLSPPPPPRKSRYYRQSASRSKSPPSMGLGQTNILNTVNKAATNLHTNLKVGLLLYSLDWHVALLMSNVKCQMSAR
jgi:hypothetical protein